MRKTSLVVYSLICLGVALMTSSGRLCAQQVVRQDEPRLVVQIGHAAGVDAAEFSPDGRLVATASRQDLILWHAESGAVLRRWELGGELEVLRFTRSGRKLLAVVDSYELAGPLLLVFSTETGDLIYRRENDSGHREKGVEDAAFSPDGERLLITFNHHSEAPVLVDLSTGRTLADYPLRPTLEQGKIRSVFFAPSGDLVATVESDRFELRDPTTGEVRAEHFHQGLSTVSFSPAGARGLSLGNPAATLNGSSNADEVRIWDTQTGEILHAIELPEDEEVQTTLFSRDGERVAVLALLDAASGGGRLRVWEVETGELRQELDVPGGLTAFLSPDLSHLLTRSEAGDSLRIWSVQRRGPGDVLGPLPDSRKTMYRPVRFSPDGRRLLTGIHTRSAAHGATALWSVPGRTLEQVLEGKASHVEALAYEATGRYLATGSWDHGEVHLWSAETGELLHRLRWMGKDGESAMITRVGFDPEGERVWAGSGMGLRFWHLGTGETAGEIPPDGEAPGSPLLMGNGSIVATVPSGSDLRGMPVSFRSTETGELLHRGEIDMWGVTAISSSPSGELLAVGGWGGGADGYGQLRLWSTATGSVLQRISFEHLPGAVAFSPDDGILAVADIKGTVHLVDPATGQVVDRLSCECHQPGLGEWINTVAFSPDGTQLMAGTGDGTVHVWSVPDGEEVLRVATGPQLITGAFAPDGRHVAVTAEDRTVRLVSLDGELARLTAFQDGGWAIVTPDGRFDTSDLERTDGLHWVMPDDPFTPVPLEAFMRDYYEPRLLPRLLAGEEFPEIGGLMERNRVQPEVRIDGVELKPDGTASVTVRVASVRRELGGQPRASEVHDVRLFRDGQLVAWKDSTVASGEKSASLRFDGIALPTADSVMFSAYAFNDDRVKSRTDYQAAAVPAPPVRERRAYVISLGVDRFDEPAWNLGFAANDARQFQRELPPLLERSGQFDDVVPVQLISSLDGDRGSGDARKETVRAVLALLAGEEVPAAIRARIPNADRLRRASPDDLIIVTVSTHGYTDDAGVFYLLPEDIPVDGGKRITPELRRAAISSDELSQWLRGVDAGELVMIVDACHAAAAVEGKGFKPGPMGSRGLGQLAFDKSMRILTATQSADVAWENSRLRQGLLSFALIENGLLARQADHEPEDGTITLAEWLGYGVERVPELHGEVLAGSVQTFGRGEPGSDGDVDPEAADSLLDLSLDSMRSSRRRLDSRPGLQTPSLFDFTRERPPVVLVGAGGGSGNE